MKKLRSLNEYQDAAWDLALNKSRTWGYLFPGLVSEIGELAEIFAKGVRDGYPDNFNHRVKSELGDILWFVACLCRYCGYDLENVARSNIEKLYDRRNRGVLRGSGDER